MIKIKNSCTKTRSMIIVILKKSIKFPFFLKFKLKASQIQKNEIIFNPRAENQIKF